MKFRSTTKITCIGTLQNYLCNLTCKIIFFFFCYIWSPYQRWKGKWVKGDRASWWGRDRITMSVPQDLRQTAIWCSKGDCSLRPWPPKTKPERERSEQVKIVCHHLSPSGRPGVSLPSNHPTLLPVYPETPLSQVGQLFLKVPLKATILV